MNDKSINKENTQNLIDKLVKDHKAIKRDLAPITRTFLFLYATLFISSALLYLKTPFEFHFQNSAHFLESVTLFVFINIFTFFCFESFVPGANKKKVFLLAVTSFVLLTLVMLIRLQSPQTYSITRPYCEFESISISVVTTLMGHFLLKRSEYAKKTIFAYGILYALPMLATFFLHMTCNLTFWHVLECHILPPVIIPSIYLALKK